MSFIFILFILGIFAAQIWVLKNEYRKLETLEEFSSQEKTALQRQLLASILSLVFTLSFLSLFTGMNFSFWAFGIELSFFQVGILCVAVSIGYISISSIKNRVSILRPKGSREPSRGTSALVFGIIMFIGTFVMVGFLFWQGFV